MPELDDLIDRMVRTRDGNTRLIDALVAQNVALDAAIAALSPDAPVAPVAATLVTPTKPAPVHTSTTGRRPKHDYPKIAAWIASAKADGSYSLKAIAEAFGVKEGTANNFIGKCRALGLLTKDNKLVASTPASTNAPTPPPDESGTDRRQDPRLRRTRVRGHIRPQQVRRPTSPLRASSPPPSNRCRTPTSSRITR